MRPIKFRAILHLDKVDDKIPAIDIMIDAVAVYPDGSIGFNEQSLKEKLPKNYEIYGDDFGAEIKYADEEGEYFETVFTMLSGEEWFWVEKDFDVYQYTGQNDRNNIEIYEGNKTTHGKVFWHEEQAAWAVKDEDGLWDYLSDHKDLEVIKG